MLTFSENYILLSAKHVIATNLFHLIFGQVGAFRGLQLETLGKFLVYDSFRACRINFPTTLSRLFRSSVEEEMILNEEMRGVWRKKTLSYLELLCQHFYKDSEESHGNIKFIHFRVKNRTWDLQQYRNNICVNVEGKRKVS